MNNVSSVALDSRPEASGTTYTVCISIRIPPDTNEASLPLQPIIDTLYKHLREPCVVLSRGEAERKAMFEGHDIIDCYDGIYSTGELRFAIENRCKDGETLTIAEDPTCYGPRFGDERDEISIKITRNHISEHYLVDEWDLITHENADLVITLGSPLACGWYEEETSNCGFELQLSFFGRSDTAAKVANAIKEKLSKAYL